jgi:hypothetical protein
MPVPYGIFVMKEWRSYLLAQKRQNEKSTDA